MTVIASFLDDIFSFTVDQHLEQLEVVLSWLHTAGLKAKLGKCSFVRQEMSYLGHIISSKDVSTDPAKVDSIPTALQSCAYFWGLPVIIGILSKASPNWLGPCILHKLVADFAGTKSRKAVSKGDADAWTLQCKEGFFSCLS